MGNSILNENLCCCFDKKILDIYFYLEDLDLDKCNIALIENYEINNEEKTSKDNSFKNIVKIKGLNKFIELINKIMHNFNHIPKENLSDVLKAFKNILSDILSLDEIKSYIKNINEFQDNCLNLLYINNYISLFKLIYNKRNEIKESKINYFIESIYYLFKTKEVLNEDENKFFIEKLNEIFLSKNLIEEKNINEHINIETANTKFMNEINKIDFENKSRKSNITFSSIPENDKNKINEFLDTNENKTENLCAYNLINTGCSIIETNTNLNFNAADENQSRKIFMKSSILSSYSENSQHQIKKMQNEINDLKKEVEQFNIVNNKKYMTINFLDENEKEEFSIRSYLNENDKFSAVMDRFYEKYPQYEDKKIQFTINGKKIKRNESIKNLDLNCSSVIIEDWN